MGLFDQEIDPTGGVSLEPSPMLAPLTPPELGVPPMAAPSPVPMPAPPQMAPGPGNPQRLIAMALLGLAAGLGPRRGNGIAQGIAMGQHENEVQRQTQFRNDQAQYKEQQQEAIRQQALQQQQQLAMQRAYEQRQQKKAQALETVMKTVPTFKTKEDYDRFIDQYGNLQVQIGLRELAPNALRAQFPYRAPNAQQLAADAAKEFFDHPLIKKQMENDWPSVLNGSRRLDLMGTGQPQNVPILQMLEIAGQSIVTGPDGRPVGTVAKDKGEATNIAYNNLIEQFTLEHGYPPDAKTRNALLAQSIKIAAKPKTAGDEPLMQVTETDPDTGEIVTSLVPKKAGEVSRKPAKEPNQAQFQAGAYAGRMEQSAKIIDQLEKNISGMHTLSFATQSRLPPAGQSADYQSYDQAARNFVNAVLRKESGAAISASEFDNARKQYLPQPGDTEDVLKQKKENRDYAFQTMKAAAGRGYQPPIEVPNADEAVIAARKRAAAAARP